MTNERLLLIKKHTDMLIEQTRSRSQETFVFKPNKQMETFSISPRINLVEEGKWLLAVRSSEATNTVLNITDENNTSSITIPGHWFSRGGAETINKL